MKCLQKVWNNSIDEYFCWCENFVIFVHIRFLFFFSNSYFLSSFSKWSLSLREIGRRILQNASSFYIKPLYQVFMSSLFITSSYKVFYQVFVSSLGIYQVFVSSLRIKSSYIAFVFSLCIKSWYQVFISSLPIKSSISSLRIKSSCQVFVSSLCIKSSYQVFVYSLCI